jgi:hypothetical protein
MREMVMQLPAFGLDMLLKQRMEHDSGSAGVFHVFDVV